jgi:hypothetical protein
MRIKLKFNPKASRINAATRPLRRLRLRKYTSKEIAEMKKPRNPFFHR